MGKMKDKMIDQMNSMMPDDTDWDYDPAEQELEPSPREIDLVTGKKMWEIKDYKIWAYSYKQALKLLPKIEGF